MYIYFILLIIIIIFILKKQKIIENFKDEGIDFKIKNCNPNMDHEFNPDGVFSETNKDGDFWITPELLFYTNKIDAQTKIDSDEADDGDCWDREQQDLEISGKCDKPGYTSSWDGAHNHGGLGHDLWCWMAKCSMNKNDDHWKGDLYKGWKSHSKEDITTWDGIFNCCSGKNKFDRKCGQFSTNKDYTCASNIASCKEAIKEYDEVMLNKCKQLTTNNCTTHLGGKTHKCFKFLSSDTTHNCKKWYDDINAGPNAFLRDEPQYNKTKNNINKFIKDNCENKINDDKIESCLILNNNVNDGNKNTAIAQYCYNKEATNSNECDIVKGDVLKPNKCLNMYSNGISGKSCKLWTNKIDDAKKNHNASGISDAIANYCSTNSTEKVCSCNNIVTKQTNTSDYKDYKIKVDNLSKLSNANADNRKPHCIETKCSNDSQSFIGIYQNPIDLKMDCQPIKICNNSITINASDLNNSNIKQSCKQVDQGKDDKDDKDGKDGKDGKDNEDSGNAVSFNGVQGSKIPKKKKKKKSNTKYLVLAGGSLALFSTIGLFLIIISGILLL